MILNRKVNLPNSVKRTDSELQAIMVGAVELNTVRGSNIISVYLVVLPLGGSIVTLWVELVSGSAWRPEPATKMVYDSRLHSTQEDMS